MLKRTVNFILRREECKNIPVRVHIICEGQVLPPPQKFEQQAEICKEKKAQERQRCQKDCAISKLIWMLKIMMKYTLIDFLLITLFMVGQGEITYKLSTIILIKNLQFTNYSS